MDAYRQAASLSEQARKANPNDPLNLSELANYRAYLGDRSEPLDLLKTALALGPDNPDVLVNAAETYELLGYHDQAVSWLRKALELHYPRQTLVGAPGFDDLLKDPQVQQLSRK
jgi:tetratricopeptide (TPR) repeat protein